MIRMKNEHQFINFGAGNPSSGWLNLDSSPFFMLPRQVHWLLFILHLSKRSAYFLNDCYKYFRFRTEHKLPYPNDSIEAIYCAHVLEHIPADSINFLLTEFNRILIKGGIVRVIVPDLEAEMKKIIENNRPWNDISHTLGTLPKEIIQKHILAALEGLFGFPSAHKTIILRNNLSAISGTMWDLKLNLNYLESRISIQKLTQVENEGRCRNAIIFEMIKK